MNASSPSSRSHPPLNPHRQGHSLALPQSLPPARRAPHTVNQRTRTRAMGEGSGTPASTQGTSDGGASGAQPIDLTLESSDDEDEPVVTRANIINRRDPPAELPLQAGRRIRNEPVDQHFDHLRRITAQRQAEMQAILDADLEDDRRRDRQINYNGRQRQDSSPARARQLAQRPYRRPQDLAVPTDFELATRPETQDDLHEHGPNPGRIPLFSMARLIEHHLPNGSQMREAIRAFTQGFIPGMGFGVAGPGPGHYVADDIDTRLSRIKAVERIAPERGFAATFDLDTLDGPIAIDEDGMLTSKSLYLDCAICHDPLLLSSAYQSPADRVWALRCGHMVDQKCLDKMTIPVTPEQIKNTINFVNPFPLDEEPPRKRSRARRPPRGQANKPPIHVFLCPVDGCGREHTAIRKDEVWMQTEDGGAIQSFI